MNAGREEPADEVLVARVRQGDAAAADRLVRRHLPLAYTIALAVLGSRMDAEDVCQDAMVRALEKIDDCRSPSRFRYWLAQIVRNLARNALAKQRVRSGPALDDIEQQPAHGHTSEAAEQAELREALLSALARLTPVQREVVLLKDLEGWEHRMIAATLGMSEGMSRQHLFVARGALRTALGAEARRDHLEGPRHG
jgi:RNA polymerase sigma-70 factor (ECF subfamily)